MSTTEPVMAGGTRVKVAVLQVRYQVRLLLRSPSAPFFTLVVPLMLLITLDLVYGSRRIPSRQQMRFPQFYFTSMVTFATVNACYINIINGTTLARESGMLKRVRGTPMPGWVYLAGRGASAALIGALSVTVVAIVSMTAFAADMPFRSLPGSIVLLAAGMICFSSIGLAITPLVPTAEAALPIAYGTFLPISFVSDVFFPGDTSPVWLKHLADALPLRPLARALAANAEPDANAFGFDWRALGVMAAWTAVAGTMLRFFRWEPSRPSRRRHSRSRSGDARDRLRNHR